MTSIRSIVCALALSGAGPLALAAADAQQHDAHHPAAASAPAKAQAPRTSAPADATADRMDSHMKVMRDMHDKMMKSATPEERNALMAEHMKAMREGMAMMNSMAGRGMGRGMQSQAAKPGDIAARQQMLEKRMDMMQMMMEMMMDRLPPASAK